jgi:hypothetical protein
MPWLTWVKAWLADLTSAKGGLHFAEMKVNG